MNNYEKLLYKTNRQKRQLRILMAKNKQLKDKLNQLETNIAEAIKLLLDNTADYTDGDFESMRFQNDIVKLLERGNEWN